MLYPNNTYIIFKVLKSGVYNKKHLFSTPILTLVPETATFTI